MKKILSISTSLRENSNLRALCEEFARGARKNGHDAELISLKILNSASAVWFARKRDAAFRATTRIK